ncbi:hypothetical protein [Spectribacter hydrogenoxidans]|uniref:Uncharacterized protein n=1 Tax=Spectribacter hydrogenoxidans TaxID=3075608 RepID=A0ABU3BVK4_9GAMM|nr:hypothetical protein [Salinisphaera sp. W335]MDT0633333.1 hypothetical protein [Salinisphaera sp. W335]
MTQLTLRGFDPELEKRLRELAARDHLSLNKAALKLMRRGAGLEAASEAGQPIGDRLKRFAGRMPAAEAERIDQAIDRARLEDMERPD